MKTSKGSIVHAAIASTCAILVAACGAAPAGGDVPGESSAAESSGSSQTMANADTDNAVNPSTDDAGASYFTCHAENDCVAVDKADNCCYNGWKIAVAATQVSAYERATACPADIRHLCPEYVVLDRRVPTCNVVAQSCEMVNPKIPIIPIQPVTE